MKRLHDRTLRFACTVLCVWVLFSGLPVRALNGDTAEDTVGYSAKTAKAAEEAYGDAIDIEALRDALSGEYVEFESERWYRIQDADGLLLLSRLVNEFDRFRMIQVCLGGNIDLSGVSGFAPIGNGLTKFDAGISSKCFQGTFDGCGYRIYGLKMSSGETDNVGEVVFLSPFGVLGQNAKVQNLVIAESCEFTYTGTSLYSCTAGLAGRVLEGAVIQNVLSLATVSGGYCSGGLVARLDSLEQRTAAVQSASLYACSNAGTVSGQNFAGGLIGLCRGGVTVRQSKNSGSVSVPNGGSVSSAAAGGLIGRLEKAMDYSGEMDFKDLRVKVSAESAVNAGNIYSNQIAGGLVGSAHNNESDGMLAVELNFLNCRNAGSVTAAELSDACGAFVGTCVQPVNADSCADLSDEVRLHGSQVRESNENMFSVRFVGSIAAMDYREIGFYVTVEWNGKTETRTLKCNRVFETMTAGQNAVEYTASALRGGESPYLYAMTISEIPADCGTVSFYVTPYGFRNGSSEAEVGEEFLIVYNNGVYQPLWER